MSSRLDLSTTDPSADDLHLIERYSSKVKVPREEIPTQLTLYPFIVVRQEIKFNEKDQEISILSTQYLKTSNKNLWFYLDYKNTMKKEDNQDEIESCFFDDILKEMGYKEVSKLNHSSYTINGIDKVAWYLLRRE